LLFFLSCIREVTHVTLRESGRRMLGAPYGFATGR
jgi:hypothetical protein